MCVTRESAIVIVLFVCGVGSRCSNYLASGRSRSVVGLLKSVKSMAASSPKYCLRIALAFRRMVAHNAWMFTEPEDEVPDTRLWINVIDPTGASKAQSDGSHGRVQGGKGRLY